MMNSVVRPPCVVTIGQEVASEAALEAEAPHLPADDYLGPNIARMVTLEPPSIFDRRALRIYHEVAPH